MTFYEIPMIGGAARFGKWFIDSGMRRGTPAADHEHVITVYHNTAPWKRRLGVGVDGTNNDAYLVLLGPGGRVAWRDAGEFSEQAFDALFVKVMELLGQR